MRCLRVSLVDSVEDSLDECLIDSVEDSLDECLGDSGDSPLVGIKYD